MKPHSGIPTYYLQENYVYTAEAAFFLIFLMGGNKKFQNIIIFKVQFFAIDVHPRIFCLLMSFFYKTFC